MGASFQMRLLDLWEAAFDAEKPYANLVLDLRNSEESLEELRTTAVTGRC